MFYESLKDYNPTKKRKVLVVFDDMIADVEEEEEISTFQLLLYHNLISKCMKLNVTFYFIMKIFNKREFQQIVLKHSSDFKLNDFMKFCKYYTKEPSHF